MKVVTFLLHTKQPILATSLQGDPNSDVSHSYIPGSMIRGMLISRYLRKYPPTQADILDNDNVKRLFFHGKNRYLNAYLFDREKKQRTLPIPFSLYKEKGQELDRGVWDFSQTAINRRSDSPQRLEQGFCLVYDSSITVYQEKRRINIHNRRNRQRGRGNEGSGAVFRYDAIDAGQTFQSVVLCDSAQDVEIIKSLLQPEKETEKINAWLGGSQSAGYGHVTIELLPDDNNWHEVYKKWEERKKRHKNLTVTLLSDTILRDECGQNTTDPQEFVKVISQALDVEIKHIDTYASSTIVGGFNRKWGLPLPQVPALAAGSVFVFKSEQLDAEKVNNLEIQGIGERRVDGFGRIVFNWLTEESRFSAKYDVDSRASNQEEKSLSSASEKLAKRMAERLLRQKLDELLLERLEASTPNDSSKISNSQLSRLMIVAKKALTDGKPDPIEQLLSSENLTKTARDQFKNTKINDISFDEQVIKWLQNFRLEGDKPDNWIRSHWKERTNTDKNGWPKITIGSKSKTLDNQLSLEYTLRLIIAVTKKMMKDKNND